MPDEQLSWLQALLSENDIWCVLRKLPPNFGIEQVSGTEFLTDLQLVNADETGGLQLFFGRSDFTPRPIWRTTENGDRDIDFIRSKAIQYCPSIVVGKCVLLEGQLGIMRHGYYEEAGIDPIPVQTWFKEIALSFARLGAVTPLVLRDMENGQERIYADIIATSGALEWQRSGHLLKQFLKGAYEFHIPAAN